MSRVIRDKIRDALRRDELGMAYAVVGDYRVRTTFQPIFRASAQGDLKFAMVSAGLELVNGSRSIGDMDALYEMGWTRQSALALAAILAIDNMEFADGNGLALYLPGFPADVQFLETLLEEIDAHDRGAAAWPTVTLEFSSLDSLPGEPAKIARLLRSRLMDAAMLYRGAEDSLGEWMSSLHPGIIRVDAAWLTEVNASAAGRKLLPALFSAMHAIGIKALVDGLSERRELMPTVRAGADYVAGDVLHRRIPAGAPIDPSLEWIESEKTASNVVPFQPRRSRPVDS